MPPFDGPDQNTPLPDGDRSLRSRLGLARAAAADRTAIPLGSLTQRPLSDTAGCPECGSARITQIDMTLTDGTAVDFTSCHVCAHSSWATSDGVGLNLADVLHRARKVS